jgi:hypothetical protein
VTSTINPGSALRGAQDVRALLRVYRHLARHKLLTESIRLYAREQYMRLGGAVSWTVQINDARTWTELLHIAGRMQQLGAWDARYQYLAEQRQRKLLAAEYRLVPIEDVRAVDEASVRAREEAIRLDERVRVLREVRNTAAKAYRDAPLANVQHWVGIGQVVDYLSWKLGEARRAAGLEPPREH